MVQKAAYPTPRFGSKRRNIDKISNCTRHDATSQSISFPENLCLSWHSWHTTHRNADRQEEAERLDEEYGLGGFLLNQPCLNSARPLPHQYLCSCLSLEQLSRIGECNRDINLSQMQESGFHQFDMGLPLTSTISNDTSAQLHGVGTLLFPLRQKSCGNP